MSTRNWHARVVFASTLLAVGGGLTAYAADRPDAPVVVEEIVAKVNGNIVTRGDLRRAHDNVIKAIQQAGLSSAQAQQALTEEDRVELRNEIDNFLLVQKGKDLDINVDSDLTKEIAGYQSESKISDPDKFHDYVTQNTGMSYEDWRQKEKDHLIADRVVSEQVWRNITIPDADLQKYYDAHKADFVRKESVALRVILVSTGDGKPATVDAARKKIDGLLARARAGTDKFDTLARQYSDDPSAADDGLLPTQFERGAGADPMKQLNKAIEDVVFSHEKGYITDVIQIRSAGFAIYRVEEHIPAGQATFDDVKNQINSILAKPIADPKLRSFLTDLRKDAYLQIKDGYVDAGAAPGKDTAWKDPAKLMPETTTKAQVANQRHFKKLLGVIPYGYTGEKDTTAAAPPTQTPVQQAPPAANADGTPNR
jgi:parvulin-like peptidyl-prolyl isomerase